MKKLSIFWIVILVSLAGCGEGGFESSNEDSAESAALAFFDNIYNQNNFKEALNHASPRMTRLMKSYHTSRAVARHVINLRYDGDVRMEIDAGDSVGRAQFATKKNVSIFFSGNYQGNKIDELRTVKMIKEDGKWLVESILADRFM